MLKKNKKTVFIPAHGMTFHCHYKLAFLSFRYPEFESDSPDSETEHSFRAVIPRKPQFVPIITPPSVPLNPNCKFKFNIQLPTTTMYSHM